MLLLNAGVVLAQTTESYDEDSAPDLRQRRLNGPRLGLTYIIPRGEYPEKLEDAGIGKAPTQVISQFGWHFEWLVVPQGGGPAFVVELIPLIGGVEYATVLPTLTLAMGIRLPGGFEFGMGPSVLFTPTMSTPVHSSLIVAAGKSIDFSGVSIPLNLSLSTNKDGQRVSFTFGYAMGSRRSREKAYRL
jgi:hypothetical protein